MGAMHRILLVEDSRDDADLFGFALDDAGLAYVLHVVGNERELRAALASFVPSVVVSDLNLPGYSGLNALALLHHRWPELPLILLTGSEDVPTPEVPVTVLSKSQLHRLPPLLEALCSHD